MENNNSQGLPERPGFCPNCGGSLTPEVKFCPSCGTAVAQAQSAPAARKRPGRGLLLAGICAAVLLLAFLFWPKGEEEGSGVSAAPVSAAPTAAAATPEPSPETTPEPADAYFETAQRQLLDGDYYGAVLTILDCGENAPGSEDDESCSALLAEIVERLGADKPESGTELSRTFLYQGGGLLRLKAESGPTEVLVTDVDDPTEYVRFYVREGETAEINLPASTYHVSYKIGILWFGDGIGFGELCEEGELDEDLPFKTSSDNAWISNSVWTVTL